MPASSDAPFAGSWSKTARGYRAVKKIIRKPCGSIETEAFDAGQYFKFTSFGFSTIEDFASAIEEKARDPRTFMVYGHLHPGLDPSLGWRRRWADPDEKKTTLRCGPVRMFVGDVDKVVVPDGLGSAARWVEGAYWVRAHKTPTALAKGRWVVWPSASTGNKADCISFRYVCLLDEYVDLARLKAWTLAAKRAGYAVDDCVDQPGQPIFIARPIYVGMVDPLAASGLVHIIDGDEAVHLDLDEFQEVDARYMVERRALTAEAMAGGWRAVLQANLGGFDGFNLPLKDAARAATAHGVDIEDFVSSVWPIVEEAAAGDDGRLQLYRPAELRRLYRNFSRIDAEARAHADANLRFLGLK
jgi:hypothetical protein